MASKGIVSIERIRKDEETFLVPSRPEGYRPRERRFVVELGQLNVSRIFCVYCKSRTDLGKFVRIHGFALGRAVGALATPSSDKANSAVRYCSIEGGSRGWRGNSNLKTEPLQTSDANLLIVWNCRLSKVIEPNGRRQATRRSGQHALDEGVPDYASSIGDKVSNH